MTKIELKKQQLEDCKKALEGTESDYLFLKKLIEKLNAEIAELEKG